MNFNEYREAFKVFDKNGDGSITKKELKAAMMALGHVPTDDDLQHIIDEVDSNGNGVIEFEEFIQIMLKKLEKGTVDRLREAFRVFDKDGNGLISSEELRNAMINLGEKMTEEEADEMVAAADSNGDGFIDYKGCIIFVTMMVNGEHSLECFKTSIGYQYTHKSHFSLKHLMQLTPESSRSDCSDRSIQIQDEDNKAMS
ncbi:hypothetical protein KUTeg_013224 [Tegillarca granosa]|uniref:EF-hand domain-containing protein n=1 Tax=Tegillarca granosa TaxID=220873 RepID=A0ABQ9EX36_TEGGR|nr:hypothetical protein KUTeg_013224 [Tegillarca granosa]